MIRSLLFCLLGTTIVLGANSEGLEETFSNSTYKCCPNVGCFSWAPRSPFAHIPYPPQCMDVQNPKFYISTPENSTLQEIQFENLDNSTQQLQISTDRQFYVIIQGFNHDFPDSGFMALGSELNAKGHNVMFVDWSKGASRVWTVFYSEKAFHEKAIPNARVIAVAISRILDSIMHIHGLDAKNIHLVGHSLGSHVAGFVGAQINNVGSIIGLDVAGLYFDDEDPLARLDPTDALFVQAIHTSEGYLGSKMRYGHADFFANGGSNQPYCGFFSLLSSTAGVGYCSHRRAVDYFMSSIKNSNIAGRCQMKAFPCRSRDDWMRGKCYYDNCASGGCPTVGYGANPKTRGKFYFGTLGDNASASGFCGNQLKVSFKIESGKLSGRGDMMLHVEPKQNSSARVIWRISQYLIIPNTTVSRIGIIRWTLNDLKIYVKFNSNEDNAPPIVLNQFTIMDGHGNTRFITNPLEVDCDKVNVTLDGSTSNQAAPNGGKANQLEHIPE